ncbi:UNVERIFIED_CONTAM: Dolichyl-diphosphooligosaccharide--protein glycosyltransferase subunit [Sesamum calycinum]|uniref:Dolichyl-diphosphooligosaccharide--protein glycosyltransferase 48 kDa subunit n=1 Tax=Sesamum calycinum TaxID=2727403 RepID=A0AAW2SWP0_9LAMI
MGSLLNPINLSEMAGLKSPALYFFLLNLISLLPLLAFSFSPDHPTDRRILVLLDDLSLKSSHSLFFSSLQSRGFDLDFKLANDPAIAVKRYGEYLYDGLILFSPSTERFGGSLDMGGVLEFVDSGHDLILAADSNASDLIRNIAAECGVDFDEDPSAVVIDHTSYAVSETEGEHTLIAADDFIQSDVILGSKKIEAPVLFEGIAHSLNPENSLVLKILSASSSSYSANPTSKLSSPPSLSGTAISLVSVVQARNNARIMVSGSLEMFSNRLFRSGVQKSGSSHKYGKSGNEQFITELSKWIFHERGHLKAVHVKHNKVGETEEPPIYRINDDLEFSVEVFEWSGSSWVPYVANDVQVQFYMMSPYVLKTLSTNQKGLYHTSFKVPDVYGVFQFKVEYQRLGYTSLSLAKQFPYAY